MDYSKAKVTSYPYMGPGEPKAAFQNTGTKLAKERKSLKGIPKSPEHRKKISDAVKGKTRHPLSHETKQKISSANVGRKRTPEQIQRIKDGKAKCNTTTTQ